ncbi:MAG: hypothetical protein CL816_04995 [Coxiellaceae bacterium]|nr:hypothetical protein [Coxiellaceae bacterium]|tara:strand:+ start:560 stop:1066 length:507 start_codon:yes stop_codon:yes gene_type:complete
MTFDEPVLSDQLSLLDQLMLRLVSHDGDLSDQPWLSLIAKIETCDEQFYKRCYHRALSLQLPVMHREGLIYLASRSFSLMRPRNDFSVQPRILVRRVQQWLFIDDPKLPHHQARLFPELTPNAVEAIKNESAALRDHCQAHFGNILNDINHYIQQIQRRFSVGSFSRS